MKAMSEPITHADLRRLANLVSGFLSPIDGVALAGLIDGVISHAKSASPPRAPGASAQAAKVGVESGPGQPTDICERLESNAEQLNAALYENSARLEREAAATIRMLHKQVAALEHEAFNLANRSIGDTEAALVEGQRKGIEEAAHLIKVAKNFVRCAENPNISPYIKENGLFGSSPWAELCNAIRALADKPAQPKGEST